MDPRTYIRLHDGMPGHPKVVGLSHAAFRLYVASMCWCSQYLTDGAVSDAAFKSMPGWSAATFRELTTAGLVESGNGSGPGWIIHDYTEHQRTASEVAEAREVKRVAGLTGNHERWHLARDIVDPSCELCAIAELSQVRSLRASVCDPNASQETETDKEKIKTNAHVGSDEDADFTGFWAIYPRKVGKGQARKAWRSAVLGQHVDPKAIIVAAEEFRDAEREKRTLPKYIPYPATWLNGERWSDDDEQGELLPDDDWSDD